MTKILEREPCNPEGNTARRNQVCAERGCRPFEMTLPEGRKMGNRWYYPDTRLYKAREQGSQTDTLDRLMALNVANYKGVSQRGGGAGGRGGGLRGRGGLHGRSSSAGLFLPGLGRENKLVSLGGRGSRAWHHRFGAV